GLDDLRNDDLSGAALKRARQVEAIDVHSGGRVLAAWVCLIYRVGGHARSATQHIGEALGITGRHAGLLGQVLVDARLVLSLALVDLIAPGRDGNDLLLQ